jgi:hypothetical protein
MQLEMIKAVDALDERPFAIGLEMFYRLDQPDASPRTHHSWLATAYGPLPTVHSLRHPTRASAHLTAGRC